MCTIRSVGSKGDRAKVPDVADLCEKQAVDAMHMHRQFFDWASKKSEVRNGE